MTRFTANPVSLYTEFGNQPHSVLQQLCCHLCRCGLMSKVVAEDYHAYHLNYLIIRCWLHRCVLLSSRHIQCSTQRSDLWSSCLCAFGTFMGIGHSGNALQSCECGLKLSSQITSTVYYLGLLSRESTIHLKTFKSMLSGNPWPMLDVSSPFSLKISSYQHFVCGGHHQYCSLWWDTIMQITSEQEGNSTMPHTGPTS